LIEIQQLVRSADQKAAIFLTLAGALAGVGAKETLTDGGLLHNLQGASLGLAVAAGGLLLIAVGTGLAVVFPRMAHTKASATNDLLFFALLLRRPISDVAADLRSLDESRAAQQLATQLVAVSHICWRKHALLRVAIASLGTGGVLLAGALVAAPGSGSCQRQERAPARQLSAQRAANDSLVVHCRIGCPASCSFSNQDHVSPAHPGAVAEPRSSATCCPASRAGSSSR
jgi:Pycsar effector protein